MSRLLTAMGVVAFAVVVGPSPRAAAGGVRMRAKGGRGPRRTAIARLERRDTTRIQDMLRPDDYRSTNRRIRDARYLRREKARFRRERSLEADTYERGRDREAGRRTYSGATARERTRTGRKKGVQFLFR